MKPTPAPLLPILLLLLALAACSDASTDASGEGGCAEDSDCLVRFICVEGACILDDMTAACQGDACEEDPLANVAPPEGTPPAECPSGDFEEGICTPTPPEPPAPPELSPWTCPEGWSHVAAFDAAQAEALTAEGVTAPSWCEPPPVAQECPAGRMPVVGQGDCVPIGLDCPEEPWHDAATLRDRADGYEGDILYVAPDGDDAPDGSRARPYPSIAQALEQARDGDIVAIGAGRYEEELSVLPSVSLVGACAEGTTIAPPDADEQRATIRLSSPRGALLSDLRVSGERPGVGVGAISSARVQSVWLDQTVNYGLVASGSDNLSIEGLYVSGTRPRPSDRNAGVGLRLVAGATVTIAHTSLVQNHEAGLLSEGDTELSIREVLIADTQPRQRDRSNGAGLIAIDGPSIHVERSLLAGNHTAAIVASGGATRLTLSDSVLADTALRQSDMDYGVGILAQGAAQLLLNRSALIRNHHSGLYVVDGGTRLEASDVIVADTQPNPYGYGVGLTLLYGAELQMDRAAIVRCDQYGAYLSQPGTLLTLNDVIIADTAPIPSNRALGFGVTLQEGAALHLSRGLLLRNADVSLFMSDPGSQLQASDLIILDTQPNGDPGARDQGLGRALGVQLGATAEIQRAVFARNPGQGMFVYGEGTRLTLSDAIVTETQPDTVNANFGMGLSLQGGAALDLARAAFTHNHSVGVIMRDAGTHATMTDLLISDTAPLANAQALGDGLIVTSGAVAQLTRASIARNHDAGIQIAEAGSRLEATDLLVTDTRPNPNGADFGRGLNAFDGATVTLRRALLARNHNMGVMAWSEATQVTLEDTRVTGTLPNTSPELGDVSGSGIASIEGATVTATRFDVSDNTLIGVQLAREGTFAGTDGAVQRNFIGVNVQSTEIDLGQQMVRVNIHDNCCGGSCEVTVCNVETQDFPIPESSSAIDALRGAP